MFIINRPSKPVVIYDGACGLCAGNLKWLFRIDTLKKFEAMPYQAEDLLKIFPHLKLTECANTMHLVFPDGQTFTGADAFRQIFLRSSLMFLPGVLLSIPPLPWVLRRMYPVLARNRYRIGGVCKLPTAPTGRQDTYFDSLPGSEHR